MNERHQERPGEGMLTGKAHQAYLSRGRQRHRWSSRAQQHYGEPPSVAGLLLYPDTPTKMETTSRAAFCHKPVPLPERGQRSHLRLNGESAFPSTAPRTAPATGHTAESRAASSTQLRGDGGGERPEGTDGEAGGSGAVRERGAEEAMRSLYQNDFLAPLPQHLCRRRTPAHPQPDNIAINPSLRIEFSTVQRETYPGWPVTKRGTRGRPRAPQGTGRANATS